MREIKFRGKIKIQNEQKETRWVYGSIVHQTDFYGENVDRYFIIDGTCTEDYEIGEAIEVSKETVGQYTGFVDENGKEIYEGDIVKTSKYGIDDGRENIYAGFDTFSVKFLDEEFCLINKWRRFNFRPLGGVEIIGNIYDNPELLGSD